MNHILSRCLTAICLALALAACGDDEKFEIHGEVAGNPTMNIYMRYYGNDRVMQGVTPVRDGKFEFFGTSKQPAIVDILDNNYRVLGRVYIANKQNLDIKIDRHNPHLIQASGTKVNEEWSKFLNSKADSLLNSSPTEINNIVENYIAKHPTNLVATLMFLTVYDASIDPLRADSVLQSIDPEARIGRILDGYATVAARFSDEEAGLPIDTLLYRPLVQNKVKVFTPDSIGSTLLVLSADKDDRKNIVPVLKRIAQDKDLADVTILDIMLNADTATWRRTVRPDSATWEQGWMPGGIFAQGIDRLEIPQLPYFIVIDSLGRQALRTSNPTQAESHLHNTK